MDNKQVLQIPIEDIIPNRFQPRLAFDDKSLNDLANSIKQHGIIQPLVLRRVEDKYEIIAGERRYKAAKIAGLASVPAIITEVDDNTSAEIAVVENTQRKDLTAIEEAKSYKALLDKGYMTQEELAKKMSLSQAAISNKLRLLTLDEEVQIAILEEKISERHARTLLKLKDPADQRKMLKRILTERLTVRQLDEEIKKLVGNTEVIDKIEELIVNKNPEPVNENKNSIFNNPNTTTNRFFNVLEDEAANMNFKEAEPTEAELNTLKVDVKPSFEEILNQTENIEVLDYSSSIIPSKETHEKGYFNEVIKTIRDLNLDTDKVTIEELNLPKEYLITIKIKKD